VFYPLFVCHVFVEVRKSSLHRSTITLPWNSFLNTSLIKLQYYVIFSFERYEAVTVG
jgi:hypothetical protein